MKWLLILVGLALIGVACAGYVASIDLLTTQIGQIYVTGAAVAGGAGVVILALAGVTFRLDALRAAILRQQSELQLQAANAVALANPPFIAPIEVETARAPEVVVETAPPLAADAGPIEQETSQLAAPTIVGRYSAGGANYSIFSDGSIEAETEDGAFHFASMSEFKAFVAGNKRA
jgi:hypothetical protein